MTHRIASPASAGARPVARAADPAAMSDLLRRYPNIAEDERQQLLRFLTQGAQEEIVRATYVAGLGPRLIAFRKDHPEHFPGVRSWAPLALLILVTVLGVLWRVLF